MMTLVGVFSREGASSYQWLTSQLLAIRKVRDVRTVMITNNSQTFYEEADKCNFAILYHSKKRGRINVTDVTDSLYDDELQHLNAVHGRQNVLVVIDDMNSSNEDEKTRILTHQPKIRDLARDLFVFSSEDKAFLGHQPSPHVRRALDDMKRMIEDNQEKSNHARLPLLSVTRQQTLCKIHPYVLLALGVAILLIILIICLSTRGHSSEPGTALPALITVTPRNVGEMTTTVLYNTTIIHNTTGLHTTIIHNTTRLYNTTIIHNTTGL